MESTRITPALPTMGMYGTTKLKELDCGHPCKYGYLRQIHRVGVYALVEHFPFHRPSGETNWNVVAYRGYIGNEDTKQSWPSIEAALAGCMAIRFGADGADTTFTRLLGL